MIEAAVVVCVVAALLLLWWLPRGSQLKKIFSEAHLIEIAERLGPVTRSAAGKAEETEEDFAPESDPRVIITSAKIVVFYTISREGHSFSHHYSLKDQYGITAHAVGATLILYIARMLGIAPDALTLQRSEQHVYHAAFELSEEQQRAFINRPIPVPTPEEASAIFQECLTERDRVVFRPFP